jgi:HEAT repeat protein
MSRELSKQKIKELRKFLYCNNVKKIVRFVNEKPEYTRALVSFVSSPDTTLQIRAINSLGEIKAESAIPHIIEAYDKGDSKVMQAASNALAKMRDPTYLELVQIAETGLDNPQLWSTAIKLLGKLKYKEAKPRLLELLDYGTLTEQQVAAQALSKIGLNSKEYDLVIQIFNGEFCYSEKLGAARLLGHIGKPNAIPLLMENIHDMLPKCDIKFVRSLAKLAIKYKNTEDAKPAFSLLVKLIRKDHKLESICQKTLSIIGAPAIPALIEGLESVHTRDTAGWILTDIGEPARPSLIKALNDPKIANRAAQILYGADFKGVSIDDKVLSLLLMNELDEIDEMKLSAVPSLCNALTYNDVKIAAKALSLIKMILENDCKSIDQIKEFESMLQDAYGKVTATKKKDQRPLKFEISKLRIAASIKRNELSKDNGILLDDKPKPPKGNKMYSSMCRRMPIC